MKSRGPLSAFAILGCLAVLGVLAFIPLTTKPHTSMGNEGYVYEQPRIFGEGEFRGVLVGPANFGMSFWRNNVMNIDVRPKT
jgi:hypothetical protein